MAVVTLLHNGVRSKVKRPCAGGRIQFGCDAQWGRFYLTTDTCRPFCGQFDKWLRTNAKGEVQPCAACLTAEARAKKR